MFVQPYTGMWKEDNKISGFKDWVVTLLKSEKGIGVNCDSEKCKNASEKSPVHKPIDIFSSGKLQVIDQLLIFLKTR